MKVSVIVPFYNVEKYIGRCASSLLSQTLKDIEIILVDDASPDGSRTVLEETIREHPRDNVRIMTHEQNKGLPAARNTGLAVASGEYIYHCDSDDYLEPDMLEKMYAAAEKNGADYVYCDFFLTFPGSERYMKNPAFTSAQDMLTKGFLSGSMKFNVWNKLVKKTVYDDNGITFPSGHGMGEDTTMIMLAAKASRTASVHEALYHYVKSNPSAFTNTVSDKHLSDFRFNFDRTLSFLEKCDFPEKEKYLSFFKLSLIIPCLTSGNWEQAEMWGKLYPESFRYAFANKSLPFRTRLLLWLGVKHQYRIVSFYNFAVDKIYYRIRFR